MTEKQTSANEWPAELSLDGQLGPAPYLKRAKADAIIAGALERAGFGSVELPKAAAAAPKPRTRRWAAHSSAAAAILLIGFAVGSASAAVLWYAREVRPSAALPSRPEKPLRARRPARLEPATPPGAAQAPASLPLAEPVEQPLAEPAAQRPKAAPRAPEDWLEEGNRLRAERRWHKADEAYAHAFQGSSKSQAAYVARVASAEVRLEHLRDARGALTLYGAALRHAPRGPLSEEIRFGIAEAYRQLGDVEAERRALETFLREHPRSALAAQAQARLQ